MVAVNQCLLLYTQSILHGLLAIWHANGKWMFLRVLFIHLGFASTGTAALLLLPGLGPGNVLA